MAVGVIGFKGALRACHLQIFHAFFTDPHSLHCGRKRRPHILSLHGTVRCSSSSRSKRRHPITVPTRTASSCTACLTGICGYTVKINILAHDEHGSVPQKGRRVRRPVPSLFWHISSRRELKHHTYFTTCCGKGGTHPHSSWMIVLHGSLSLAVPGAATDLFLNSLRFSCKQ